MYCNHCGAKVSEDARFCAQCGHPAKKPQTNLNVKASSTQTSATDDSIDATRLISSDEIQEALKEAEKKKERAQKSAPKNKEPKEIRPAWLDEKDDPALYKNMNAEESNSQKGGVEKGAFGAQIGSAWKGLRTRIDQEKSDRQAKAEAKAKMARSSPPKAEELSSENTEKESKSLQKPRPSVDRLKERVPMFDGLKKRVNGRSRSLVENKDPANDLFIYLYIGVIAVALVIGVVMGLFIIKPWAGADDEAQAVETDLAAAVIWQAPDTSGQLLD